MDEFAIKLALEQGGQAAAAAASATDVSFAPPQAAGRSAPLGKLDPDQKLFPFGGFVLGAVSIGFLVWLIRR